MKQLSELLLSRGLLTKEKLAAAELEQTVTKESLAKILVRNGFMRQEAIYKLMREMDPNSLHEESVYQRFIPNKVLQETKSMVTAHVENTIYVSTLSPTDVVRAKFKPYIGTFKLEFTPANPVRISEYLANLRNVREDDAFSWERIFQDAMRLGASDVHIIPRHASYTVMLRRDGVLHLHHEGEMDEYVAMVSRVKDLSKMDMAERRRPQDGGFSLEFSGRLVNFRVTTVPTVDGERMVVRILDPDSVNYELDTLGITRLKEWRKSVGRPDGLCLICGPTGSGKTTTLAATVREMNFLERAVYSVEDPVENRIPYAGQVNVNHTVNLDFSSALRAFMRADPDVILVGEVRDLDTARNALKGSETGHLVIATLHTSSIINAISRLKDIGVEPYELRHLLRGVMVQRLMRVYCSECHGDGCSLCGGTGYRGREVVSEVAYFNDESDVMAAIEGKVSWPTIWQDAKQKVLDGRTSATEFRRVFGVDIEEVQ